MRVRIIQFLIIFLIGVSVECSIKACHLNQPETNECYKENVKGMLNIFKRMRNKPESMFLDTIAFNQIVNDDGAANVQLFNTSLHNLLNVDVANLITTYDGDGRKFHIDLTLTIPKVSY